ncbi:nucleoside diphosphate kinase-like isoform X2 [Gigantopelta aegis]|uniref:nucleoside diphosphate kinase-like isoform X2 n=1 Tax=Gigantopelta aegis TaxID=1735272 RepID=UPI001B889DE5|nr:nucleoside diphosphate kinase-like isoform X2 [Gigantopelta aegis]
MSYISNYSWVLLLFREGFKHRKVDEMLIAKTLQLTLAILKPDVVKHPYIVQEIRELILANKFYFVKSKLMHLTKLQAAEFYKEHDGKFFQGRLINFMTRTSCCSHACHERRCLLMLAPSFRTLKRLGLVGGRDRPRLASASEHKQPNKSQ